MIGFVYPTFELNPAKINPAIIYKKLQFTFTVNSTEDTIPWDCGATQGHSGWKNGIKFYLWI